MYTVGQFARICNVSAKTLRHYDEIGLFSPAMVGPDNQYRYYSREQIPQMRRILFFRDLGLGLEVIRELVRSGAVADLNRVEVILKERAEDVRREIALQHQLLSRIENAVAAMRREGEVSVVTEQTITVKEVPSIEAVGVRKTIAIRDVESLFREAGRKLRSRPVGPPMTLYYDAEFDPENVDMEVLFPVVARGERTLPAAKVAAVTHVGPYETISRTYAEIFAWVNQQVHNLAGPPRELYLVGPESCKSPEEFVTEIQIPIG